MAQLTAIKASDLPIDNDTTGGVVIQAKGDKLSRADLNPKFDELEGKIDGALTGFKGSISIADTPTEDGYYAPIEAGTYTNAGGLIYDPEGVDKGYKVTFIKSGAEWVKDRQDLNDSKTETWTAKIYGAGKQVFYDGKIYEANENVTATDIPGVSTKWVAKIDAGYIPIDKWFDPRADMSNYPKGAILSINYSEENTYTGFFKLNRLTNRVGSYGVLVQFQNELNEILSQYAIMSSSAIKTGIEIVKTTQYLASGLFLDVLINWDVINGTYALNIPIIKTDEIKKTILNDGFKADVNAVDTVASSSYVEALKTYLSKDAVFVDTFPYQSIISIKSNVKDTIGREFYLSYFRNNSTGVLFQFTEKIGSDYNIVSQLYKNKADVNYTGIQEVVVPSHGGSGIDFTIKANFSITGTNVNALTNKFKIDSEYLQDIYKISNIKVVDEHIIPTNVFGDIMPEPFKSKLNKMDDDLEVVILGDSLIGLIGSCTPRSDASQLPPACNFNHLTYRLYDSITKNKVTADRWDSERGGFVETGTFEQPLSSKFDAPNWAGEFSAETSICMGSNEANAAISFDWDLDAFEKLNFINRKTVDGVSAAVFTIAEGNDKVEILDKATGLWSEANGATISQYIDPTVAVQYSNYSQHVRNWRTKLRRKTGATGVVNVEVSKGPETDRFLYYWGTEKWNNQTVHFTNVGRGGRATNILRYNFINDVVERKPDLVIFSAPLANEYNTSLVGVKSNYSKFIYGTDLANNSLKERSNDFTDFQVLVIIPHGRGTYWDGNKEVYKTDGSLWGTNGELPYQNYQRIKQHILDSKEEGIAIVDIGTQLLNEGRAKGWTFEQSFSPTSAESKDSFTIDTVHTNDYGIRHWAKYLIGLFSL